MEDFERYLGETLGIAAGARPWDEASSLPLFLSRAANYFLCDVRGAAFIAAVVKGDADLPALKRVSAQVSRRSGLPVVLVCDGLDARQRKALIGQGVPFVVPERQAYLPFAALIATERGGIPPRKREKLSARAQAAFVTALSDSAPRSAAALRELSGMSASDVSRALAELQAHGLIEKGKDGRAVVFDVPGSRLEALGRALPCLFNPISRTLFARLTDVTGALPDAGATALAGRSMLGAPGIVQKAASTAALRKIELEEVLEGELPDDETVEIQAWAYDPLVAGREEIDDISLALSLVDEGDERVIGELNALFGEDGLWQ